MNVLNQQSHEIVIYSNRKQQAVVTSIIVLVFLYLVGRDSVDTWAFWNHSEMVTATWIAALALPIILIWPLYNGLVELRQHGPTITINPQGFFFSFSLRSRFWLRFRQSFIPWEEIEWIALSRAGISPWLSLSLKDPVHYWSLYGNGPSRKWRRGYFTGAHIDINPYFLSLSASQILLQIEEHYSSELRTYEIQIKY